MALDETQKVRSTALIEQAKETNLQLARLAAKMRFEITAGRGADLIDTYEAFRFFFIELFYLVRLQPTIKESDIMGIVDKWSKSQISFSYPAYSDALKLYDDFSELLAKKNIL